MHSRDEGQASDTPTNATSGQAAPVGTWGVPRAAATAADVVALQRSAGNRAVARWVAGTAQNRVAPIRRLARRLDIKSAKRLWIEKLNAGPTPNVNAPNICEAGTGQFYGSALLAEEFRTELARVMSSTTSFGAELPDLKGALRDLIEVEWQWDQPPPGGSLRPRKELEKTVERIVSAGSPADATKVRV